MNWSTIIAVMLLGYGIGFYLLWSWSRGVCAVLSAVEEPLARYARMTRKDRP